MLRSLRRALSLVVLSTILVGVVASPSWATVPRITKFTPVSAVVGTNVKITGSGLSGVKGVRFNGVAAKFKSSSALSLSATVPPLATTGKITISTAGGTATSKTIFKVLPSISSFTPSSGIVGSTFTINGGGLAGATSVTLGGLAATYTVNTPQKITVTVPASAVTGTISVTTPSGNTATGSSFAVLPHISSFASTAAAIGASVVITGTGFDNVTGVTFNGSSAGFVVNSNVQITATVPTATSGPIAVTTASGTATTGSSFTVLPSITLNVSSGPPTGTLIVGGYGFTPNSVVGVYFDSTELALIGTSTTGTFSGLQVTVPASATPGSHMVSGVEGGTGRFGQTAFSVSTDWAMFRDTPSHRGSNPYENVVGTSNVGDLFQQWTANTNGVPTSPAIVKGVMYVGSGDFKLYAFDASTGTALWNFPTTAAITGSPAVVNGVVYVVSSDGKLWAIDAVTGAALWGSPTVLSGASSSSPTVVNGIVFVGTSTGNLYAIDAVAGTVDWTTSPGSGGVSGSPAVANGSVVFTTTTGRAIAYNATAAGGLQWNVTLGGSLTTPLIVAGSVYVGSSNQNMYALSLATGGVFWNSNPGTTPFASAPSFSHGVIYIGANDGNVYAFDTTGNNPWANGNGTAYQSPIAVANGVVYAGSNDNGIYAFDTSGNILWSGSTNGQVKASPVLVNGTLYAASNDGHVYVYQLGGA